MTSDKLELSLCTECIDQNVFCISGDRPIDPRFPSGSWWSRGCVEYKCSSRIRSYDVNSIADLKWVHSQHFRNWWPWHSLGSSKFHPRPSVTLGKIREFLRSGGTERKTKCKLKVTECRAFVNFSVFGRGLGGTVRIKHGALTFSGH